MNPTNHTCATFPKTAIPFLSVKENHSNYCRHSITVKNRGYIHHTNQHSSSKRFLAWSDLLLSFARLNSHQRGMFTFRIKCHLHPLPFNLCWNKWTSFSVLTPDLSLDAALKLSLLSSLAPSLPLKNCDSSICNSLSIGLSSNGAMSICGKNQ